MKTTPEALKALYQTLGGSSGNVAGETKTTGILNKIAALFGSTATADKIPDAIDNINAVASGVTKPDGKITITENATDINVAQYATADVSVSGGGGSSDLSTASVTITANAGSGVVMLSGGIEGNTEGSGFIKPTSGGGEMIVSLAGAEAGRTQTWKAVLTKGDEASGHLFESAYVFYGENAVVTGDCEISDDCVIVYGDCTITADPVVPQ